MSRRTRMSATSRRSAAAALALGLVLSLSACGGDDENAATAEQAASSTDMGAAAGGAAAAGGDAAAAAMPEGEEHADGAHGADGHDETNADGHHADEAAAPAKAAAIPADAPYNAQDVKFLQHMADHHGQAVEMSEMVKKMSKNAEVKKLGLAIHGAQAPEIAQMTAWLKKWGQSTENAPHSHDPNAPSAGMMTDEDMAKLHAAGKNFDKVFLQQMIFHHQGAVNQSKAQIKDGKFKPAIELAKVIIKAQTAEIKQMKALLKKV